VKRKSGWWTNLHSHLKSCVGADYQDQFNAVIDAGGGVGVTSYSHKANIHAIGGRTAGSALQGLGQLDRFVLRVSEAETEMAEWINYLVVRNMPISIVDCPATR
jgi:hypothetical protein